MSRQAETETVTEASSIPLTKKIRRIPMIMTPCLYVSLIMETKSMEIKFKKPLSKKSEKAEFNDLIDWLSRHKEVLSVSVMHYPNVSMLKVFKSMAQFLAADRPIQICVASEEEAAQIKKALPQFFYQSKPGHISFQINHQINHQTETKLTSFH